MFKLATLIVLALFPVLSFAQIRQDEETLSGGLTREELPLAVIWGLSLYGGVTGPFAPEAFVDYWHPGPHVTVDADILLRNDVVLGLSIGYSKLKFNQEEFWGRRGADAIAELDDSFNIPISTILLSYRGIEHYVLHPYAAAYEIGGGIYNLKNTEIDITYIDPYGSYVVSEADRPDIGIFAGLGIKCLITDTFQVTVKGRFHHVFKPVQYHQFYDLMLGITIL